MDKKFKSVADYIDNDLLRAKFYEQKLNELFSKEREFIEDKLKVIKREYESFCSDPYKIIDWHLVAKKLVNVVDLLLLRIKEIEKQASEEQKGLWV